MASTRFPRTKLLRRLHDIDEELSSWESDYEFEMLHLHPEDSKRETNLQNRRAMIKTARRAIDELRVALYAIGL